jgi:hypothetical protein
LALAIIAVTSAAELNVTVGAGAIAAGCCPASAVAATRISAKLIANARILNLQTFRPIWAIAFILLAEWNTQNFRQIVVQVVKAQKHRINKAPASLLFR